MSFTKNRFPPPGSSRKKLMRASRPATLLLDLVAEPVIGNVA
jgi:hypothetical protein